MLIASSVHAECDPCPSCVSTAVEACLDSEVTLYDDLGCDGTPTPASDSSCSHEAGISFTIDVERVCSPTTASVASTDGLRTYCCVP